MIQYTLIIILALVLSGCARMTKPDSIFYSYGQQKKLSRAVTLMTEGKSSAAADLLSTICSEKGVAGVTDEALFRLSLLKLGSTHDMKDMPQARYGLERLRKEYPDSVWVPLALPLREFLTSTDEVRSQERKLKELNLSLSKENRDLKELNLSLSKENRDLRQSIEKLKNLEIELGRRTKH